MQCQGHCRRSLFLFVVVVGCCRWYFAPAFYLTMYKAVFAFLVVLGLYSPEDIWFVVLWFRLTEANYIVFRKASRTAWATMKVSAEDESFLVLSTGDFWHSFEISFFG